MDFVRIFLVGSLESCRVLLEKHDVPEFQRRRFSTGFSTGYSTGKMGFQLVCNWQGSKRVSAPESAVSTGVCRRRRGLPSSLASAVGPGVCRRSRGLPPALAFAVVLGVCRGLPSVPGSAVGAGVYRRPWRLPSAPGSAVGSGVCRRPRAIGTGVCRRPRGLPSGPRSPRSGRSLVSLAPEWRSKPLVIAESTSGRNRSNDGQKRARGDFLR